MISAPDLAQPIVEEKQKLDINPHVGEEAFTLVTTGVHTTIKDSSLYRLVEDLCSENSAGAETKEDAESAALLNDYRVEPHIDADQHKCWLIYFDTPPKNHLFLKEGFEFKQSHLRIDARFANDNTLKAKQGLSRCHSTEEYVHPVTKERKVVHVFIGENGYISSQIKKYKTDGTEDKNNREDSKENSLLEEKIRENAEPAIAFAKKILQEKRNRYAKAKKKSYEIDAELKAIMQNILINGTQSGNRVVLKEQYRRLVDSFLAEIAKINRYEDQEIDERGVMLEQCYACMNRSEVVLKVTESKEANERQVELEDSSESVQTAVVQDVLSKKKKSKNEIQLKQDMDRAIILVEEIKVLMEQLKPLAKTKKVLDASELILRETLKQTTNEKLIELAFLSSITKENNAYLEQVTKALNKIPPLLESFKCSVELGELERVTQLYPYVQHENLKPIFYNLIFKKIVQSTKEELEKVIKIARFFYEKSIYYRTCMQNSNLIYMEMSNYKVSLLFHAFLEINYLAFELFLEQGLDPNGIGIIFEDVTCSVMNAIIFMMNASSSESMDARYIQYIEKLLSFGALVDNKTRRATSRLADLPHVDQLNMKKLFNKNKLSMSSLMKQTSFLKKHKEVANDTVKLKETLSYSSALEMFWASGLTSNKLLELLVPKSGFFSLLKSYVCFTDCVDVKAYLLVGAKEAFSLTCENKENADEIAEKMFAYNEIPKYVSQVVYHTDPQKSTIWIQNVAIVKYALHKKFEEVLEENPEYIAAFGKESLETVKRSQDLSYKNIFYKSVLYVQLLNADTSFEGIQKIVQTLCYLGNMFCCHGFFENAINAFLDACLCCETLEFSERLKTTPLFQFAKKKLKELGINDEEQENPEPRTIVPRALTEMASGGPITSAALIHTRETPSLAMLADANTETPSASAQENLKGKKKKTCSIP